MKEKRQAARSTLNAFLNTRDHSIVGSNAGRELQMSDRERNLGEKLLAQRESIILTSGRAGNSRYN